MRHNTNSRMSIQITKKCTTVVAHCLIVGPNSLGGQSREGEVTWPLMTIYRAKIEMKRHFQLPGDHRQGGLIINVRKPPKVKFSWHGTFKGSN